MKYLLLVLILFSSVQAQDVKDALFNQFGQVQSLCHNSVRFDLVNDKIAEVRDQYHERMNCLFSTAAEDYLNTERDNFHSLLEQIKSEHQLEEVPESQCEGDDFKTIKAAQLATGYASLCTVDGDGVAKEGSLCQITETAFNEFCGYQEFLYFRGRREVLTKRINEEDLWDEPCPRTDKVNSLASCIEREESLLEAEQALAQAALEQSLTEYQNLLEGWTLHGWLTGLTEALKNTYRRLDLARTAFEIWPDKFENATSLKGSRQLKATQ